MLYLNKAKKPSTLKSALRRSDCILVLKRNGDLRLGEECIVVCENKRYSLEDTFVDKDSGFTYTAVKRYIREGSSLITELRHGMKTRIADELLSAQRHAEYTVFNVA